MTAADAARQTLEQRAVAALHESFGRGSEPAVASAPGRCTLVGEHVDYAGGLVLCAAIDLHVTVAARATAASATRVTMDGCRFEDGGLALRPEGAGYVFAAAEALRRARVDVPPFEAATVASLPAGAGLSSSAAVVCATLVALLRLAHARLSAIDLAGIAYDAEHNVLGVPCGRLDQYAVVDTPGHGALLLDSSTDRVTSVPWRLSDAVLVVCDTAERHRVAGPEYARRRAETAAALERAGLENAQQAVSEMRSPRGTRAGADDVLDRRLRHVAGESRRAAAAAEALARGDAPALGRLMSESHRSLRDDHEVSTPLLDAVVAGASAVPGCYGARMVGAGFGGSVLALATTTTAAGCVAAMRDASGRAGAAWVVHPHAGLAYTAGDAVIAG